MASQTMRTVALLSALTLAAPALAQAAIPEAAQQAKAQGDQLARAGNLQGAKAAYLKALKLDPTYALAHNELGTTYFKLGRHRQAIAQFQAAVKADPTYDTAWFNLAYAAKSARRWQIAVGAYRHYLKIDPSDADARYGLAEALDAAGETTAAAKAYDAYAASDHRASEQGRVAKARARAKALRAKAARPAPAPQPAPAAQPAPTAPARPQQARAATAPAPEPKPAPAAPPRPAAKAATGARVKAEAARAVSAGDGRMRAKAYGAAVTDYTRAVKLAPNDVEAHYKLGYAYALAGHLDKAIPQWQTVLRLDPGNAGAKKNIEVARKRLAAEHPRAAAPAAPSASARAAARTAYEQGVRLINQRKYPAAVAALTTAIRDDPTLSVAWIARGSAYVGERRYRAAIQDYEKGHQLSPAMASPLFGLGEAHRALGENAKAVRYYEAYAASHASDANARLQSLARQWAARLR